MNILSRKLQKTISFGYAHCTRAWNKKEGTLLTPPRKGAPAHMPRLQRIMAAGLPQHVIQRGNNREDCFFADADYAAYLQWLERAARTYRVAIHAYVLMTNHVHLLATPGLEGGVSKMMQYLGRYYVQYINKTYGRSGTLWERRFHASVVETEAYLLTLQRYIELNPVRAGIVKTPEQYKWSSARDHLAPVGSSLIVDHEVYMRLGATPSERASAYAPLIVKPLEEGALSQIRTAARQGCALGSDEFKDQIEIRFGRRVRLSRPGRKPKQLATPGEGQAPSSPAARVGARPLVFALLSLAPLLLPEARTIRRG